MRIGSLIVVTRIPRIERLYGPVTGTAFRSESSRTGRRIRSEDWSHLDTLLSLALSTPRRKSLRFPVLSRARDALKKVVTNVSSALGRIAAMLERSFAGFARQYMDGNLLNRNRLGVTHRATKYWVFCAEVKSMNWFVT